MQAPADSQKSIEIPSPPVKGRASSTGSPPAREERTERIESIVGYVLKASLVLMGIESIIRADWLWVFGSFFSVFVCSIPHIVEKRLSLHVPLFLELSITVAVFLHAGGAYLGFYGSIPGYDHITHSVSSVVVALLALVTTYMLSKYSDSFKLPPLFIGLFVVILSMAFGVVWEMLEWILDYFTGAGAQYGNDDTMWDLVFDTIGGLIVGILGGISIRHKSFDELLEPMEVDIVEILNEKEKGKPSPSLDYSLKD